MDSTNSFLMDMISRGNTVEGLAALEDQPMLSALNIVNRILYGEGGADNPIVQQEKERHLALLPQAQGEERANLLYNLGCFALLGDDVLDAKSYFQQALLETPDLLAARHNLAYTHELMAEYAEARQLYQEVLEQEPSYSLSRINLDLLQVQEGNLDGAIADLEAMLEEYPANRGVLFYLCRVKLLRGGQEAPKGVLQLLNSHQGWQTLKALREVHSYASYLAGDLDRAEEGFSGLIEETGGNAFAWTGLMKVRVEKGDFEGLALAAKNLNELAPSPQAEGVLAALREMGY